LAALTVALLQNVRNALISRSITYLKIGVHHHRTVPLNLSQGVD